MNICFPSLPLSIQLPVLKNNILTIQQKKILLIVSASFAVLTACYMVKRCYSFLSVKSRFVSQAVPKNILQLGNQRNLFVYLKQHGKSVSELDLSAFSTLNDQDLETITAQCPNLQKLIIKSAQVTNQGLQHLQTLKALQSLSLEGCKHMTDQEFQHLQKLTALQSLNLEGCIQMTDQGLQHLQKLTALQSLNLSWCDEITDQGLKHLQALKALRSLNLNGCNQITDQGLKHLQAIKNLICNL